jgi:hypothetical protein
MGHTLICVSPFIHKILKEEHGIESKLVPNAIDPTKFQNTILMENASVEKPIILHGITSVNKGADILDEFKSKIGTDFDVLSIDEVCQKYSCSKEYAYKLASVMFMPSKWEASSYLLLEALAAELPFVAYRSGVLKANPDGIDTCGKVIDNYDVDEFVKACTEVIADNEAHHGFNEVLKKNRMTMSQWIDAVKLTIYEVL